MHIQITASTLISRVCERERERERAAVVSDTDGIKGKERKGKKRKVK
jgi:hypothetical protein